MKAAPPPHIKYDISTIPFCKQPPIVALYTDLKENLGSKVIELH